MGKLFDAKSDDNIVKFTGDCLLVPRDGSGKQPSPTAFYFCSQGSDHSNCVFMVNYVFEREYRPEAPIMDATQLVRWAVRVLSQPLAEQIAPHQALPMLKIIAHPTVGPKSREMLDAVEKQRGIWGKALPEAQRNRLRTEGEVIELGCVRLLCEKGKLYKFNISTFSFRIACEFAAYILRDLLTKEIDEKVYVDFLPTRDPSAWDGADLSKGEPAELPKLEAVPTVAPKLKATVIRPSSGQPSSMPAGAGPPPSKPAEVKSSAPDPSTLVVDPTYPNILSLVMDLTRMLESAPKDGRLSLELVAVEGVVPLLQRRLESIGVRPGKAALQSLWMAEALKGIEGKAASAGQELRALAAAELEKLRRAQEELQRASSEKQAELAAKQAEIDRQRAELESYRTMYDVELEKKMAVISDVEDIEKQLKAGQEAIQTLAGLSKYAAGIGQKVDPPPQRQTEVPTSPQSSVVPEPKMARAETSTALPDVRKLRDRGLDIRPPRRQSVGA